MVLGLWQFNSKFLKNSPVWMKRGSTGVVLELGPVIFWELKKVVSLVGVLGAPKFEAYG